MLINIHFFYKMLNFFIKYFLKIKSFPVSFLQKNNYKKNIIYILQYDSIIDILILRSQCLKYNLPDPLCKIKMNDIYIKRCIFINNTNYIFSFFRKKYFNIKDIFYIFSLLKNKKSFSNINFIPVYIFFGKYSDKKNLLNVRIVNKIFNFFKKITLLIVLGRNLSIIFSKSISINYIIYKFRKDKNFLKKLIRLLNIRLLRSKFVLIGPFLNKKKYIFNKILNSSEVKKILTNRSKNSILKLKKNINSGFIIMREAFSSYSYKAIYLANKVLKKIFKYAYKDIFVYNIKNVQNLSNKRYVVIYIPCHRSHMDYLILSYVLYNSGISPPHIAAGINLNFWPIGTTLKLLGAFFIRRSFKGNRLYFSIIQEYLNELFIRGNSVEYFIEGGRSRTGKLLYPQTGMLIMTLRTCLNKSNLSIVIIPTYIGYENIIEIKSYEKEILGFKKKKENMIQILQGINKLNNLGSVCINFGCPIILNNWLKKNKHYIKYFDKDKQSSLLSKLSNKLSFQIMEGINSTTVINIVDICSIILISSPNFSLTRYQFFLQLDLYCKIFKHVPYSSDIILPKNINKNFLLNEIINKFSFSVKKAGNKSNDIIFISKNNIIKIFYHSNMIKHLLILPSLISNIIFIYKNINFLTLNKIINMIYPFLKKELFVKFDKEEILYIVNKIVFVLQKQNLLIVNDSNFIFISEKINSIKLLAFHSRPFLRKLMVIFCILKIENNYNKSFLIKKSISIIRKIMKEDDLTLLENIDRKNFSVLVDVLYAEKYIRNNNNMINLEKEKIKIILKILKNLI
ncbi:plsB [Wigglesworthia glossinidia endosymbiont of Glossina brevipalpis]|uniref:Glycerol-3-phosphate acyltransferase n=1 Tax=Wigglesworthia glossinidia brevipalpis TaxID=36870 RepID=Q8D373_WIGBR|nr:plsB [Wigglesworthia glossinidia endosymbiont of Glossina brevipalpis]